MITNFRLFENLDVYKKGDYILIDLKEIRRKEDDIRCNFEEDIDIVSYKEFWSKIKNNFAQIFLVIDRDTQPYRIRFYNDVIYDIDREDIIRHLTPDEIDTYEAMKISKKYNL